MKPNRLAVLIVATTSLLSLACGPGAMFETGPDVRGSIEAIIPASVGEEIGFIRIGGKREADTDYDRADVGITRSTVIVRRVAGSEESYRFDSLRVGQRVEASFTGKVMESMPVRATAQRLVVIE